ncbi:penicillin acylase family protein [Roseococcus suduntuyensis]|uniref:Penicillin amidase n=1 Tax=Roseococcus suduntuyensis TaxID=455361 RepID=A0A840A9X1_9PROT|nr:penicillin acylase family protein [Roseococcus suduntuyensis]MBB3897991.1 penicillin amidase [Roseococcus suduntuyensis]
MRRRRRPSLWRGALLGLLLLVLAVPALALGLVWWTLPPRDESLALPGLSAPVEVSFDAHGIPRIRAATERDATMALGYLHARDRLFQMETMRRGAEGRLSEIAGGAALRLDRFSRVLGLAQRAEADLAGLEPATRHMLEAYAAGVNAWIAARGRFAAPEFLLLGAPEPWEPRHSLLWAKVMGLWLSNNFRVEMERARLATLLPAERLWDLWPLDGSAGRPDLAALPQLDRVLAAIPVFGEDAPLPNSASNAWAVAGPRAGGTAPLLAADPHLGYGAPVLWYLVRVELADGGLRAGATSPGVPFLVFGRTNDLAWGFTTTHSDTQDVYIEPESAARVVRTETIRVRGREPVTFEVRETGNGPVLSDLDETPRTDGQVLAVRMANLEPGDTAADGLRRLAMARDLAGARDAAARITSPPQNLMVAARDGGIAMYLTGRTPLRTEGDGAFPGTAPWQGFIPFDELPHVESPGSGLLVNANNRVSPEGHPAFLGRDWYGDWRFRRIHELLSPGARFTLAGFAAVQMDTLSLPAREALPFLNTLPRGSGAVGAAQALLAGWDGDMDPARPEPLIWAAFSQHMPRLAVAQAGAPDAPTSAEFLRFLLTDPRGEWWCGGDCRAMAALAMAEAVRDLVARFGPEPAQWRWGQAHQARFDHPLLRFVPVLNRLTGLAAPVGGDGHTVQRQSFRMAGSDPFAAVHGAGLRIAVDLSDADATEVIIGTGQSGHPLSRHWGDLLERWQAGETLRLTREPTTTTGHLRLTP